MKRQFGWLVCALVVLLAAACGRRGQASPTPTVNIPTQAPAATPSATAVPAIPSATPSAAPVSPPATPSSAPVSPLASPGPGGAPVSPVGTPASERGNVPSDWIPFTSPTFDISLQMPPDWGAVQGYDDRYGGSNGFFQVAGIGGAGLSLDEVCDSEAHHVLQPYGSQPLIEQTQVDGQAACLILPSPDQPADMQNQSAIIVAYPQPRQISGQEYNFLVLWADQEHIGDIAHTLRFGA
jgi:predicted small lipoprotein YifL